VVDRFYTYVYQGDGLTWVLPHPSQMTGDVTKPVLDKPYHPKYLPEKLRELALKKAGSKEGN
jgi:hypothetical protein